MQQAPVQFVALAPDHLLAITAAQIVAGGGLKPRDAVNLAVEVIAESVLAVNRGDIAAKVNEQNPDFQEEQRAKIDAAGRGLMVPGGPIPPGLLKRNLQ